MTDSVMAASVTLWRSQQVLVEFFTSSGHPVLKVIDAICTFIGSQQQEGAEPAQCCVCTGALRIGVDGQHPEAFAIVCPFDPERPAFGGAICPRCATQPDAELLKAVVVTFCASEASKADQSKRN